MVSPKTGTKDIVERRPTALNLTVTPIYFYIQVRMSLVGKSESVTFQPFASFKIVGS